MCDRKTVSDGVSDHHSTDGGDRIEAESGTKGDQDNGKRKVLFGHPQRGRCCGKGGHQKIKQGTRAGAVPFNQTTQNSINGTSFPNNGQHPADNEDKKDNSLCICKRPGYNG